MRKGIKLNLTWVIPKTPLTFHSPSRGKAVSPFLPTYPFCLAGQAAQTPEGTVELVKPVTKPCNGLMVSLSSLLYLGDLINQHTPQPTQLLGSFRSCLLMETTSAKTAAINRMNAGSLR